MSSNKKAKEMLMKYYGTECFIEKLKLRRDITPRRYSSKGQMKRMKQLTYHHIRMKKDGGHATLENGALLSAENHAWFHKQNEHAQGYMNALFQEYKKQVDECRVVLSDNLHLPFTIKTMVFNIDDEQDLNYNRAKEKQEIRKQVREYLDR